MQRCLSGLRSTIGNRVMRERIRRFKSSSLRQRKNTPFTGCFFVELYERRRGFEGGSRFARAKRFADDKAFYVLLAAKDAIDNGGAGRAAKGENPLLCARKQKGFSDFAESLFSCQFFLKSAKYPISSPTFCIFSTLFFANI